jgi:hypothetical protein
MVDFHSNLFNFFTEFLANIKLLYSDLIGEAKTDAEQGPAENGHVDVHGAAADRRTGEERHPADDHGRPAPAPGREPRREEQRGEQAGDVERGGEERQQLAVELAVVADAHVALHPPVHVREELPEERPHG